MFTPDVLTSFLMVGAGLFALGLLGFMTRRNLIVMFLSVELMLQGSALTLVAFGKYHGNWTGQVLTIIVLTVAASEAAVALALILVLFNRKSSLDAGLWTDLREPGLPPLPDDTSEAAEPLDAVPGPESYPSLTPAGVEPPHAGQAWERRRD
jgi:NADH-quinone oxidoreductase subunit K